MKIFSLDGEPRKWYEKKRYLFPLAFIVGAVAAFVDSLIQEIQWLMAFS